MKLAAGKRQRESIMRIYGDANSGNCQKVKWTADYLGQLYDWRETDVLAGETRTEEFLARNPFGQVPVLELQDGRTLAQSNAIIRFLARNSELIPADDFAAAQMDAWLFWEQYSHEPYIAVCRFHMHYLGRGKDEREEWRVERGEMALDVMEAHLAGREWLVDDEMTLADVALLPYTRLAHEGGFDLSGRPALKRWIARAEEWLGLSPVH